MNRPLAALFASRHPQIVEALAGALPDAGSARAQMVAGEVYAVAHEFLQGTLDEQAMAAISRSLAADGLTAAGARRLMQALNDVSWGEEAGTVPATLVSFQLHFLEQVGAARAAGARQAAVPASALADQDRRTELLQSILALNADLTRITDEKTLLEEAVSGLCQNLDLLDVTLYEWSHAHSRWDLRQTTAATPPPAAEVKPLLDDAVAGEGDLITAYETPAGGNGMRLATTLQVGGHLRGALLVHGAVLDPAVPIFVKAFALNLAALWQNLHLFLETQHRARELEILHGHHMDNIWQAEHTLQATYSAQGLEIARAPAPAAPASGNGEGLPLVIGDYELGQIHFEDAGTLTVEEAIFVHALVREMGSALNNAHLLQTTRSYATQLRAAIEVSRAASTILERERLLEVVVELIRERFDFYYVGLYLLADEEAVLQAGSGRAGEALLAAGHRRAPDAGSVVGRALLHEEAAVGDGSQGDPLAELPATRSELALPLHSRGATIGVLDVHASTPGAFTQDEITVLQTLADQIAVAVDNASLFARVEENYRLSERLYQAGRQITEAGQVKGIYEAIIDFVAASGLVDLAFIMRPAPESRDYMTAAHLWNRIGVEANPDRDRIFRDAFPATEMFTQDKVLIIENGQTEPLLDERTRRLFVQNKVRAAAFIPIYAEEQWQATLVLDRVEANPLTEQELQPFLTLCDQAAVALANLHLLRETGSLYRISRALNQALTAEDALKTVVEEVARYTGVSQVHIILHDDGEDSCRVAAEYAPTGRSGSFRCPGPGDALRTRLLAERRPLLLQAGERMDRMAGHYLAHFEEKAALFVPAAGQQQLYGLLALSAPGGQRQFTEAHINFLQSTAEQLTTFLENINLFNEALERAQELVTLNRIGARLAGILERQQLVQVAYEEVTDLFQTTVFLLAEYNPAGNSYTPLLHVVAGQEVTGAARALADEDPLHEVLHAGEVVRGAEAVALARSTSAVGEEQVRSALWLPLQQEGKPIGLLSIQAAEANRYQDNDVQLMRGIATQTGLALSNARLFAETEANVAELRVLFGIAQAAASSIDANERIQNMVEALHQTLRGADVAILLLEPGGRFSEVAYQGQQQVLPTVDLEQTAGANGGSAPAGLLQQAATFGQPLLVNDLRELPAELAGDMDALSQLIVPLNLGQRTVGLIRAGSPEADAFSQRDLRLLETLSVSLAATIESSRLFEEIQEANEQLRELDRVKTQFLANMSHELRTPLNSIIGFSRVILKGIDGPVTAQQEEDLTAIYNSGQHLLMLINDILDLAKIEAGKMALVFEQVDLDNAANSVLSTTRGLVKDKPVTLHWEIADDLPLIEADPVRLRQIMINLLSNAAKYTSEGTIWFRVRRDDPGYLLLEVADSGIGIAPEDYDKLFASFEQVDAAPTRAVEGTGLGLPITQSLVQMHQGEIWFESELGEGTSFFVRLPVAQAEAAEEEE